MRRRYLAPLAVALLSVTAAVIWGPHLSGAFFWDDASYLRDNPRLAPGTPFLDAVRSPITGQAFRPLSTATLWLQVQLHGFSLVPLRAFHVVVHGACAGLVALWMSRTLKASLAPLAAAALFLVHPAATEAVMFVSARHDLLGAAFALCALAAPGHAASWGRAATVAFASVLAVACKETYVVLAPLVAVQAWAEAEERASILRLVLSAALGALAVFAARAALGVSAASGASTGASIGWLFRAYATLLVHHGTAFVTFHDAPSALRFVPVSWTVAVLSLVGLGALAVTLLTRDTPAARAALPSLSTFALPLAPAVAALPATMQHGNRYGYLALAGFCGLVASAVAGLERRRWLRRQLLLAGALSGIVFVVLARQSFLRAAEWHDGLTLFGADVARVPDDSRAAYHYGVEVFSRQGCGAALPLFQSAAREEPTYARAQRNVAACLLRLRRPAEALGPARIAANTEPNDPAHWRNLAAALDGVGRRDDARVALSEATRLASARARQGR